MTTPERSIEEIVEEFISENMNKTFIREKGRPKEDGYIIESYSIPFKTALEQTLQAERQKREEIRKEAWAIGYAQCEADNNLMPTVNVDYEALTQPNNPN